MPPEYNKQRKKKRKPKGEYLSGSYYGSDGPSDDSLLRRSKEERIRPRFNFIYFTITIVTFAILLIGCFFVYLTWEPQDMSDIEGYRQADAAPDIPNLLYKASKQNSTLTLSEADINRYLAKTLKISQQGISATVSRPHGVGIRLHDGFLEVVLERQIFDRFTQTISMYLTIQAIIDENSPHPQIRVDFAGGEPLHLNVLCGGKIGKVPVPQGYMILLRPALENLAQCYADFLTQLTDSGYSIVIKPHEIKLLPPQQYSL